MRNATALVILSLRMVSLANAQQKWQPPVIGEIKAGSPVVTGRSVTYGSSRNIIDVSKDKDCETRLLKASEQVDALRGDFTIRLVKSLAAKDVVWVCQTIRIDDKDEVLISEAYKLADPEQGKHWINIETERPIREGVEKIGGTTGESVKTVRIMVFSPTFAPNLNGVEQSKTAAKPPAPPTEKPAAIDTTDAHRNTCDPSKGPCETDASGLGRNLFNELVGYLDKSTSGAASDKREYLARSVECALGDLEQVMDVPVSKGRFESPFKRPIDAGQCIIVRESFEDGHFASSGPEVEFVRPGYADWGRMRGVFTVGTAIGNSRRATQADPYIGFYADASVMNHLLARKKMTGTDNTEKAKKMFELGRFSYGMHFFTEARLTQSGRPDATDSAAQTQALFFQTGFYLPVRLGGMDWRHKGQIYSFFLAPLGKYGSTWLKDGVIVSETRTDVPADTGQTTRLPVPASSSSDSSANKGAHPFFGYGARMGFFRYDLIGKVPRNRQVAPELIGYLDFTYGQNSSFRAPFLFSRTTEKNGVTRTVTGYRTNPRYSIEGRIKIPTLPIQVGADLNLDASKPDRGATEFRFVVAFRVDAARAIGRATGGK